MLRATQDAPPLTWHFLPAEAITRHLGFVKKYYQMDNEEIQEMIDRPKFISQWKRWMILWMMPVSRFSQYTKFSGRPHLC